jgi:hypothetical protein
LEFRKKTIYSVSFIATEYRTTLHDETKKTVFCFLVFAVEEEKLFFSFKLQDMDSVRYRVGAHKTSLGNKLPPTFPPAIFLPSRTASQAVRSSL